MLDQSSDWIAPDGRAYPISVLAEDDVLFAVDYSLGNAKYLRARWAYAKETTFDDTQRARRWMLQTPGIRALLRRLVELEDKEIAEIAFEEAANDHK